MPLVERVNNLANRFVVRRAGDCVGEVLDGRLVVVGWVHSWLMLANKEFAVGLIFPKVEGAEKRLGALSGGRVAFCFVALDDAC
jgi:hypothetical protein